MLLAGSSAAAAEKPPAVGDQAADFTLSALDGESVELKALLKAGTRCTGRPAGLSGISVSGVQRPSRRIHRAGEEIRKCRGEDCAGVSRGEAEIWVNGPKSSFAAKSCRRMCIW
jgi:hypothetical protein